MDALSAVGATPPVADPDRADPGRTSYPRHGSTCRRRPNVSSHRQRARAWTPPQRAGFRRRRAAPPGRPAHRLRRRRDRGLRPRRHRLPAARPERLRRHRVAGQVQRVPRTCSPAPECRPSTNVTWSTPSCRPPRSSARRCAAASSRPGTLRPRRSGAGLHAEPGPRFPAVAAVLGAAGLARAGLREAARADRRIGGMVLFLRRLKLSRPAAWLGWLVFASSAFMVVWTNWPQTRTAALIPALFWGGRVAGPAAPDARSRAGRTAGGWHAPRRLPRGHRVRPRHRRGLPRGAGDR